MYKWQYNGAAPMGEIIDWCRDRFGSPILFNTGGRYYSGEECWGYSFETFFFNHNKDYVFFLLRWA